MAATNRGQHWVFVGAEVAAEAKRRGVDPKRIVSFGCQACGAAAEWPMSGPFFGHFMHCPREANPGYLQFLIQDKSGERRLVNPSKALMDEFRAELADQ